MNAFITRDDPSHCRPTKQSSHAGRTTAAFTRFVRGVRPSAVGEDRAGAFADDAGGLGAALAARCARLGFHARDDRVADVLRHAERHRLAGWTAKAGERGAVGNGVACIGPASPSGSRHAAASLASVVEPSSVELPSVVVDASLEAPASASEVPLSAELLQPAMAPATPAAITPARVVVEGESCSPSQHP